MTYLKYFLNLPWTIAAIVLAGISLPKSVTIRNHAIIIKVSSFWWSLHRGARGVTLGNVIILGDNEKTGDLEHEVVHVEQHMRAPFIHPFLALIEKIKHGSRYSKYEDEAYAKAGNPFIDR